MNNEKIFKIIFNKKKTYILACSYGPDSMALCDMLIKNKCNFIIAFVNYHKRLESNYEQKSLLTYCKEKKIICEILDLKKKEKKENFQNWARKIRYNFFQKIYKKYHASGLFVAHQQDDLIETYIMQKKRHGYVDNFGIKKKRKIKNMLIIRPLLSFTKNELLNYCKLNNVPYAIDKSNFNFKYLRNKIRHNIVAKLTINERKKIIKKIIKLNKKKRKIKINLFKKIKNSLSIKKILSLNQNEFIITLINFFKKNIKKHFNLSKGRINEIYKICLSKKPNIKMLLFDNAYLFKEYNELKIISNDFKSYSYFLTKPCKLSTNEFEIDFTNGAEDRKIYFNDYPITIRSPLDNDILKIKNYNCKLKRVFINWKMPIRYRKIWPIICNSIGKIIYVPRYRKNFKNKHKSKFIIKFN